MAVQYSIQKMVSNGTLSTIALGIQYLQRNDIYIRIAGEETPQSGAPSGYTWSFLDNTTLKILPVVPNGVEVVVYRRTDVDAMYNIYSQNAQFDEATIDENNQQLLYIAQEYLEQGLPGTGVDAIEYVRDDGSFTYYRMRRTDGSYSEEFTVPSASSSTKVLTRESLRRSYAEAGYNLVDGSFEAGGTLLKYEDVLIQEGSGKAYSGAGPFPQLVTAGTNPLEGVFIERSTSLLRDRAIENAISVFDYIPTEQQAAIKNRTSTYDVTADVQRAVNAALALGSTPRLFYPSGLYRQGQVNVSWGFEALGAPGSHIKLLDNQPAFTRLFQIPEGGTVWADSNPAEDSPPLTFSGLILDGNQLSQGPYTGFEKQHQHAISVTGSKATNATGARQRVILDSCIIQNTCGDGISCYRSTDVAITNTRFWNCFRGGIVSTGGNVVITADNVYAGGDRHSSNFQTEADSPVNGKLDQRITLSNSVFDHIRGNPAAGTGLDILSADGSVVSISNCDFRAGITNIDQKGNGTVNIDNCAIRQILGQDHLVRYGDTKFSDCTFWHANNALRETISLRAFAQANQQATFDNCDFKFEVDPYASLAVLANVTLATIGAGYIEITTDVAHGIASPGNYGYTVVEVAGFTPSGYNGRYRVVSAPSSNVLRLQLQFNLGAISLGGATVKLCPVYTAIRNDIDVASGNNTIRAINCRFAAPYREAVELQQGGNLVLKDNEFSSFAMFMAAASSSINSKVLVAGNITNDTCRFTALMSAENATTGRIEVQWDQKIPVKASGMRFTTGTLVGYFPSGHRTIFDQAAPYASMGSFMGDLFENNAAVLGAPVEWRSDGTSFRPSRQTVNKAVTASRPALTALDVGTLYLDTTLSPNGKPIWWTGTAWMDAVGAVV